MVKVEGTLEELRELFVEGAKKEARKMARKAGSDVVRAGAKKTRKVAKSAWHKYMGQKKNQIKFKSGKKKGRLDLKKMGVAFRKAQRKSKR